jgi:hypothetical protein
MPTVLELLDSFENWLSLYVENITGNGIFQIAKKRRMPHNLSVFESRGMQTI